MVSSHTSLPGLTIATHHNKLWLSLATTLPTLNSVLQIKSKTPKTMEINHYGHHTGTPNRHDGGTYMSEP